MESNHEAILQEIERWKELYFQEVHRGMQLKQELYKQEEQRRNGRQPYRAQYNRHEHSEGRQREPRRYHHHGNPYNTPQYATHQYTTPQYSTPQYTTPQHVPLLPGDSERDKIKNKLRLACSQNDIGMLQESIRDAERLGMAEAEYARRKLDTLL